MSISIYVLQLYGVEVGEEVGEEVRQGGRGEGEGGRAYLAPGGLPLQARCKHGFTSQVLFVHNAKQWNYLICANNAETGCASFLPRVHPASTGRISCVAPASTAQTLGGPALPTLYILNLGQALSHAFLPGRLLLARHSPRCCYSQANDERIGFLQDTRTS